MVNQENHNDYLGVEAVHMQQHDRMTQSIIYVQSKINMTP